MENNNQQVIVVKSQKSRIVAALLAFFLGGLGINWFYLNRNVIGLLSLLFCWTFIPVIISFIHMFVLLVAGDDNFNKKYNQVKTI